MNYRIITFLFATLITLLLTACTEKGLNNSSISTKNFSLTASHCDIFSYDFKTQLDAKFFNSTWTASIGTIDSDGVWSYMPSIVDVDNNTIVTITAINSNQIKYISTVTLDVT